jgi:hypothetical protein
MALQTLPGYIVYPGLTVGCSSAPATAAGSLLDAAGEYDAAIIMARQAMVISHVAFRAHAVSGSPTADVRIETLDASGNPSGSLWAANTNIVTATLTAAWATHALTASATIAMGDKFAVKIAYNSGTSVTTRIVSNWSSRSVLPAQSTFLGGVQARNALTTNGLSLALGSSSSAFYPVLGLNPVESIAGGSFNNTNSAARGVRFQVPFTCRCVGIRYWANAATGDFDLALYNDAGTELSSSATSVDGDVPAAAATGCINAFFDNPVTLSPGTAYRAAIIPSTATNQIIQLHTLGSADLRSAMLGGLNYTYAVRTSGVWDDTNTTVVPFMDILIDQLDDGVSAGGGGLLRHPGMSGGLNG